MANELHAQWGQRLRQARKEQGISLRDITAKAGLHKSHYCRIEAGETVPSDELRMRLASALGVRVEQIFSYPDTTPDTTGDAPCPSAANAPDQALSPTPQTAAAAPSPAPAVEGADGPAPPAAPTGPDGGAA